MNIQSGNNFLSHGLRAYPPMLQYGFALLLVAMATTLRFFLDNALLGNAPFVFYYLAIFIASLAGGFGPGLFATLVSTLCGIYFLEPSDSFAVGNSQDQIWAALFFISGVATSLIISKLQQTMDRLDMATKSLQQREDRYRTLFGSMEEGFCLLEALPPHDGLPPDFRYLEVNPAFGALMGMPPEQMVGNTVRDKLPDADKRWISLYRSVIEDGTTMRFQDHAMASGRWFQITIFRSAPGRVAHLAADITEIKQTENRLREQAALLDLSPDAIIIRNIEGEITYWNKGAETMYGWKMEETTGISTHTLLQTVFPIPFEQIIEELRLHNFWSGELEHTTRAGEQIVVESRWQFHPTTELLMETNINITARKKAEMEIRQLNAELEQRVEERTRQLTVTIKELESFSYSISHDLRAPLRAINSFAAIMLEERGGQLDDEGRRLLQIIMKNGKSMGQLIDDLIAFFRVDKLEANVGRVDMTKLAKTVGAEIQAQSSHRNEIRFSVADLPGARGSEALLRQALINLLSNAVKFSQHRPVSRIDVGAFARDGENVYYVRDNGIGFDMQYVNKLFGVFQRLHPQDEFEGTGIGLALVKRIIERHGGKVWAEGAPDKGATFFFSLPEKE